MKKTIITIIVTFIIISFVFAFAENDFTLRDGVRFGMSRDEVMDIEKDNVKSISKLYDWGLDGKATVAGQENTEITFIFENDKLYELYYAFSANDDNYITSYNLIEDGLAVKYGDTSYTSASEKEIPTLKSPTKDEQLYHSGVTGKYLSLEITDSIYSQRFFFLTQVKEFLLSTALGKKHNMLIWGKRLMITQ